MEFRRRHAGWRTRVHGARAVPLPVRAHRQPLHQPAPLQDGREPLGCAAQLIAGRTAVTLTVAAALSKESSWRAAMPGVVLSIALALAAMFASKEIKLLIADGGASAVSPVLIGVLLGMLWRHFVGLGPDTERGVQWILATLLRIGIALVGLRLTLQGLANVGPIAIPVVIACIATALLVSKVVGRALGLSMQLQQLLAVGSAVCGCTAIVAAAPAIRARPIETGIALTCVVLVGSLGMTLYPWIAAAVFPGQALPVGVLLGSAIHDTSQVVGAALIYAQHFDSPEVVAIASATKLFRNLSIIILVPAMALSSYAHSGGRPRAAGDANTAVQREQVIPAFVVWFVILVFVRAIGDQSFVTHENVQQLWHQGLSAAQALSELLMICGMTAVGLTVSLPQMLHVGLRPICAALIIAVATASCSLGLTYALFHALT